MKLTLRLEDGKKELTSTVMLLGEEVNLPTARIDINEKVNEMIEIIKSIK